MITSVLLLIFLASQQAIFAQPVSETEVKDLFKSGTYVWWVRHYKGLMNDVHDVAIILGADGETYHGYITYLRSKTRFQLYGDADGSKLKLYEVDTTGKVSGIIKGEISPLQIKANWQNHTNKIGGTLLLKKGTAADTALTFCGTDKWTQIYEGLYYGKKAKLIVQHYTSGQYKGSFFTEKNDATFKLEGRSGEEKASIDFFLEDGNFNKKGVLTCRNIGTANVNCIYDDSLNIYSVSLKKSGELKVHCVEYADYMRRLDVVYPQLDGADDFNQLIYQQYNQWLKKAEKTARIKSDSIVKKSSDDRAMLRTYGWYDVEYFDENSISLRLVFVNTWAGYQERTINYDLIAKKELGMSDIFKEGTSYQEYIRSYISNALRERPFYKDEAYYNWVKKVVFKHFTLRENGVSFSTKFNGMYGVQEVTIPYEDLKPYLSD